MIKNQEEMYRISVYMQTVRNKDWHKPLLSLRKKLLSKKDFGLKYSVQHVYMMPFFSDQALILFICVHVNIASVASIPFIIMG